MKPIAHATLLLVLLPSALFAQALEVSTINLKVFDVQEEEPIEAVVNVYLNSDFVVDLSGSALNGQFKADLEDFGWYILEILSPGYVNYTDTIWLTKNRIINKQYGLIPIEVGYSLTLQNIHFHFNSTWLRKESYPVLDSIAIFIQAHPGLTFEVAGHTDDEGPHEYNQLLSQGRADSIVKYLVDKGIEPCRLMSKGYGESKLADGGITKAAKAKNRRVEFVVVEATSDKGSAP